MTVPKGGGFFMEKMAKKTEYKNQEVTSYDSGKVTSKNLTSEFKHAFDYYAPIRNSWEEKEALIMCRLEDSVSKNSAKSQVFDPRLLTIISERMFRVMAQLPSGKVQTLTKKNMGKSMLMDLILSKYIIPNATSQHDILSKNRMVNFYSHVYGSMPVLVDWVIRDDYVGPDYYMIPPRDFIPQPNKYSINDCDYVFVSNRVSRGWLKTRAGWNGLDRLLEQTKGKGSLAKNTERQSYNESTWGSDFSEDSDNSKTVELITKYTPDRWTTFALDYPDIPALRDIENPHKNGKLPFGVKHSFPLLDRFWGLGEVEKGQSLQLAINSLINLYLDGVKYSIFPPLKIDLTGVVQSTIKIEPGAKWVMKRMDAVDTMNVSPQGMNTFQGTYQFMIAALLNQAGTTDTTTSDVTDPGLGKTPAAVNFLAGRQNARDAYDRFQQETFIEQVYDRFIDLVSTKQEKPIKLDLFEDEIGQIAKTHGDLVEILDEQNATLLVEPKDIRDTKYKYKIDAGSTYKKDEQLEKAELESKMAMLMQMPNAVEQIAQTGGVFLGSVFVDFGEMFKRSMISSGIQDWDKIVRPAEEKQAELQEAQMQQQQVQQQQDPMADPEIQAIMQEVANGQPPITPYGQ